MEFKFYYCYIDTPNIEHRIAVYADSVEEANQSMLKYIEEHDSKIKIIKCVFVGNTII